MDAVVVLGAVSRHMKPDASYTPNAGQRTSRWNVNVDDRDVEFLCDGPKFFDTRAKSGGGGAVDLVMHLFRLDFRGATKLLRENQL